MSKSLSDDSCIFVMDRITHKHNGSGIKENHWQKSKS